MSARESRGSLMALRERYLWLWRQLLKLETMLKTPASPPASEQRQALWAQRMKRQLKRYWP